MKTRNPVVWITGASSGIGEALAREWRKRGARLVLSARRVERLEALARELGGPEWARAVACDVTQDGDCEHAVQAALSAYGRIDGAMANAGFGVAGPFEGLSLDDFRRQFETNVFGVLRTAKAVMPELAKTQGFLAITGSVAGHIALPAGSPYSMSKYAVRAFAEALRAEWKGKGISVTLLSPGFVESEIRRVDNAGQFHTEYRDPLPGWLIVPREKAAREIVRAVQGRVPERVITGHGKLLVFVSRYLPWLVRAVQPRLMPPPGRKGWHRPQN